MLKRHFSRFLSAAPERLHFAAHSHHYWPDITFAAQEQCWADAAKLADKKWDHIFGAIIPEAQRHIQRQLNLPESNSIVFAPNTHEFVLRLLSCFTAPVKILTTDSEFHSFTRQSARFAESGLAQVTRIPAEPFGTFAERFKTAIGAGSYDLIFFSSVFFNSGFIVPSLPDLIGAIRDEKTFAVVDGYHNFMALPVDFSGFANRAFFIAGGYKYAMSGEGVCFMHVPPGYGPRPVNTGWFAGFSALSSAQQGVAYASDAGRFWGSTFDATGLYRFNAVQNWLCAENISIAATHEHVRSMQKIFLERAPVAKLGELIFDPRKRETANFLTFRTQHAGEIEERLSDAGIIVDHRADRLRFGFGVYHELADVVNLCERLRSLLK